MIANGTRAVLIRKSFALLSALLWVISLVAVPMSIWIAFPLGSLIGYCLRIAAAILGAIVAAFLTQTITNVLDKHLPRVMS